MKTAERILVTSLALFNQHGENNVSSVDIAMELDISPGNLYYHFKGKEVIVAALFDWYQTQFNALLNASKDHALSLEEFFYYLYLLMEQAQTFRFFYLNTGDLADKYPKVAKSFFRQLGLLENHLTTMLQHFVRMEQLSIPDTQKVQVVELIGLVFSQAGNYYTLKGHDVTKEDFIYQSLAVVLFALLPYARLPESELRHLQDAIRCHDLAAQ